MRIKLQTLELLTNLTTCVIYNYLYTIMEYNNTKYKVNITLLQGLSLSPHLELGCGMNMIIGLLLTLGAHKQRPALYYPSEAVRET